MNWVTLVNMFSGPISSAVNKGLAMASAAFVAWQIKAGVPATDASSIAADVVGAVSLAITMLAGTQGAKIQSINAADNGVKVVQASSSSVQVNSPLA